ncbi:MAG: UDP-galactopyranose mutase [Desulfovibrio sp.]|nr:UDP-galactopyranose mutase [Desulfovibrio sp.]
MHYDYLIVGAGLFGAVFAHEAKQQGKTCLVLDKRSHIGGNIYCEQKDGINIHIYGAHIFHTSDRKVWDYVNQFAEFNNYVNSPVANWKGEIYNLPFNMNTFARMWGVSRPEEARKIIESQKAAIQHEPKNLEEQAISLVGTDIYVKLIRGYTEKQWGRACTELPAFIIKRLPVRFTYDNNYFNDRWQGIPMGGYNQIAERLLAGIEVKLGVDYDKERSSFEGMADKVLYTGPIDAYYGFKLGTLEYRGLKFETERLEESNYQGVAVMNFTEREIPYTRVIEHKHFEFGSQPVTWVTREYPCAWKPGDEAYYPVNNAENQALYAKYREMADQERSVIFGGRLGEYKYYDMDKVIASALAMAEKELG